MQFFLFPADICLEYVLTGKFKAPSKNWKHELFDLNEFELIVMTEGILYLTYGNNEFTLSKGEFLLLPPSKFFRSGFRESYCSFYWLHFSSSEFSQEEIKDPCHQEQTSRIISIPQTGVIPKPGKIIVLMKQLQDCVKNGYPIACLNVMTACVVLELYGQLFLREPNTRKPSNREQIYSDILDYVKLNISRNIKATDIAAHFGYNEKYLSHVFSSFAGMTLKKFILSQKIDLANFLLNDTNKSISEIAKETGFSDSHNFSRCYKKVTGLSPTEYRNTFSKRLLFDK